MLKELAYELSRGLAYRKIKHAEMRIYTVFLPGAVCLFIVIAYLALPQKQILLGKDGAIAAALAIFSTLPGFYFAGLAAVATFGSASMDREMPAPAPELDILIRGRMTPTKLTRRQFLSYLFSYLVILSFLICFLMVALNISEPSLSELYHKLSLIKLGGYIWFIGRLITVVILSALFSSMVVTTLHGIFFLTEKIHQP